APRLCRCEFQWQELNTTGTTSQTINRKLTSTVTNVQQSQLSCEIPEVFSTEIPNGTIVKVRVIPTSTNISGFSVTPFNYTKGNLSVSASFQDAEGRKFQNILRYSCFDRSLRGMSLQSKLTRTTFSYPLADGNSASTETSLVLASQFCKARGRDAAGADVDGCQGQVIGIPQISAQSYYYNLYVRSTDLGSINAENSSFICPTVQESLFGNPANPGSQGNYYPLDSTFALALQPFGNFNVGVEARSRISVSGDPGSVNKSCTPTGDDSGGEPANSNSMVSSCLGYAAKPNVDGTCPFITDSNGQIRQTFRLRRFTALYPVVWDTTGANMPGEGQKVDQIYVLDRPLSASQGDPLKPFTMRGPKPCPFAYYDWSGVSSLTNTPGYRSTNFQGWDDVNPDNIQFPNQDIARLNFGVSSCSAVLPLVNTDNTLVTLATVNDSNPLLKRRYVRPGKAWSPTYLEDQSFQACAPDASPHRDPPIHIASNATTGQVAWCAETYPTFNPSLGAGTTHAAATRRTVALSSQNSHTRYPLIGTEGSVEEALRSDSTFSCLVSFDAGGGKTDLATPAGGCCRRLLSAENIASGGASNDEIHFESSASSPSPCLIPAY
ncbi:MAG: hypothetical protein ACK5QT_08730, partial [Oligoflexia bacterium]